MADGLILPEGYSSPLSLRETQRAIKITKDCFQTRLAASLNLDRVTAPVIVSADSGINDDLSGTERKVSFDMLNVEGTAEIVQSLSKWKRLALCKYGYKKGEGIYTDMTAVRRDDKCDSIHSIYVDQWDWELIISEEERSLLFLKGLVERIIDCLDYTKRTVNKAFPVLKKKLCRDVFFISSQDLEDKYPNLSPKEREDEITREHGSVFIFQIGGLLKSGQRHDMRAPDYDDWKLNGDLLLWNEVTNASFEISSMGIRVNAERLLEQLGEASALERLKFPYHKAIVDGTLPLTAGGGIGQSRICMFMLEKAHIGEVQVSLWPEEMLRLCEEHNIFFL